MLIIKNLSVAVQSAFVKTSARQVPIISGISLSFNSGQVTVITGANGGGKSTLAAIIMGISGYQAEGNILLDGNDIIDWPIEKRAQAGIFLAYQYPIEVPGLSIKTFLSHAYRSCKGSALPLAELDKKIVDAFHKVGLPADYVNRNLHEGFSGGQKKRLELVQMLVLEPRIIILDEIDSGLDAQGVAMLIDVITDYRHTFPLAIFIIITHNRELFESLHADICLTMQAGGFIQP